MSFFKEGTVLSVCVAIGLSSCATTSNQPLTVQQKIAGCIGMIGVSAVLGAVIGNNVGDGNARTGAATGGLIGAGACTVWLAFQNEMDKKRIAQLQSQAALTGRLQNATWVGPDGRYREVSVSPSVQTEMSVYQADGIETRLCRPLNTTATYNGQSDSLGELWCRNEDGTYSPARPAS